MKVWKLIGISILVGALNACTNDTTDYPYDVSGERITHIAVSVDDLLPIDMNSRSGSVSELLSEMKDLNIRIDLGNQISTCYCKGTELWINGKLNTSGTSDYYIDGSDWSKEIRIHLNDVQAKAVKGVEALANWGSQLSNKEDWSRLKEEGNGRLDEGYCLMYGKATVIENYHHEHSTGALVCSSFRVELKRTRALLSVRMESDWQKPLYEGVEITPVKVSVKNVPSSCYVVSDNILTAGEGTNVEYTPAELGWSGAVTRDRSLGVHAEEGAQGKPDDFAPIYLFENKQGTTDNQNQIKKWPQGCNSIAEVKKNTTHSYIEIEADYHYKPGGKLQKSGTVIYRFFLGENILNDFNVVRNSYYRLTLRLSGYGGAKEDGNVDENGHLIVNNEDVSWRVDMNLNP